MNIGNGIILKMIGDHLWGPAVEKWSLLSDEQRIEILDLFEGIDNEDDLIQLNDFIAYDDEVDELINGTRKSLSESNDVKNDIDRIKKEIDDVSAKVVNGDSKTEGREIKTESAGGVDWGYYDKFNEINDKYLADRGEGETLATQTVTAINKLIYKWYNDGDTYDTTTMEGWANDLTSYANWLDKNIDGAGIILNKIYELRYNDNAGYEKILQELADAYLNEDVLAKLNEQPKNGSVYDCDGNFVFDEHYEDEDDGWSDYEEDEWDEEDDVEYEDYEESYEIKNYSEKLNEAKESDKEIFNKLKNKEEDKTILDLIQDRIGQDISVGELNTMLQSIFGKYNEVFLLSNMLYNADTDEPQELVIDDDNDIYTITFTIKDLEEAIIEITDVVIE